MAVRQKQRNTNKIFDQWLDIHFGDTSFNGRVVFGRKNAEGKLETIQARSLTELKPYAKRVKATSNTDTYLTANTVCGIRRRKDELFGLQNIVIDIDCHKKVHIHSIPTLVEAFIWYSKRDLWNTGVIPTPNSIVRTGRGVQLWWAIVPCYGGRNYDTSRYYHDFIKSTLIDHITSLLHEHEDELGKLNMDPGASRNNVGYFRLPYSYNTEAKCYSSVEILHTNRYDQRELIQMEGFEPTVKTSSEVARSKPSYIPMLESDRFVVRNFESTGVRRVLQLIRLRNLRNNEVGKEFRNNFNFSVYNALRMTFDHDQAMIRLKAYNSGFKQPMTQEELEICICAAKTRDGYKYTNEGLIELLDITPEEQVAIGLFPVSNKHHRKPNASRDEARRALKEDRDYKILEMIEKGMSQAETARILGISKNTVGSVVKKNRETTVIEPTVVEVATKHSSRPKNGSIFDTAGADRRVLPLLESEYLDGFEGGLLGLDEVNSS